MPGIFIFNYSLLINLGFAQVMTYRLMLKRRKRALSFLVVKFLQSFLQVFVQNNPAEKLGNGTAGRRAWKVSQCKVSEINSVHNVMFFHVKIIKIIRNKLPRSKRIVTTG
nr:MAG TPA: hypothetical protein [Caudoviricetes sp.]